jgi:gluconate 5-dehydrogenase
MGEGSPVTREWLESQLRLDGRNALLLGGRGEIGRAIADTLASQGCALGLAGRDLEAVTAIAAEIEVEHGPKARGMRVDVRDPAAIDEVVEEFRREVGPIDLLVVNSGAFAAGEVWKVPPEQWRKTFAVNVDAPFFAVQKAFPDLRERQGSVILITSIGGLISYRRSLSKVVPYTTSKAAAIHLTRNLAAQLGDFGIRVNSIAPGQIDSGLTATLSADQKKQIEEGIPLGRLGRPSDLAGAVAFLASDLSSYVSGHTLVVDGGLTLV